MSTALPSAGTLIASLSRSRAPEPAAPPRRLLLVARPALFVRLLLAATLALLLAVGTGMILLALRGVDLVAAIRDHQRAARARPEVPLPDRAVLLDRELFDRRLAGHPAEAGRLLAARARAVAAEGDGAAAALAWAEAERAGGLTRGDLLEYAGLLVDLRLVPAAEDLLRRLPWAELGPGERERATDLGARCLLIRRARG